MDLSFRKHLKQPPQKVWAAVATSDGLAAWLMPNDFAPVVGHAFTFTFHRADAPTIAHVVQGEVLEIDPPHRMVWSWKNDTETAETTVTFTLEPTDGGTVLTLRHKSVSTPSNADELNAGWPTKLARLEIMLTAA
ncbi:MAG: SRPBCC domain-containing protein [Pseudomonadota bacterium]